MKELKFRHDDKSVSEMCKVVSAEIGYSIATSLMFQGIDCDRLSGAIKKRLPLLLEEAIKEVQNEDTM